MRTLILFIILLSSHFLFATFNDLLIDPGHGGGDPGNLGWENTFYGVTYFQSEDDINLDLAEDVDWVIGDDIWRDFTRVSDDWYFLNSEDRAKIANGVMENEDGLLSKYGFAVAIHQNANPSSYYNYMRIYYGDDWHWDTLATQYSHINKHQEGEKLGEIIGESMWQNIGTGNYDIWTSETVGNGAKHDDQTISNFIDGTHCSSILIECGFLSNQDYYEQITENWSFFYDMYNGIAEGIDNYFDEITDFSGDYLNGDANVDGSLNVLDVVSIVQHVLIDDCVGTFNGGGCLLNLPFYLADYNNDGGLNVLDIVSVTNAILGNQIIQSSSNPVYFSTSNTQIDNETYRIEVDLFSDEIIRGVQIETKLSLNNKITLINKSPQVSQMNFDYSISDDSTEAIILFYGIEGQVIEKGLQPLLTIDILSKNESLNRSGDILNDFKMIGFTTDGIEFKDYEIVSNEELGRIAMIYFEDNLYPTEFSLSPLYPNPFNPVTNITYDLPEESHVTISIYDLIGRKLEDLVSDHKQAGSYNAIWDANQYSSGAYIVKMKTPKYLSTQKITLIK